MVRLISWAQSIFPTLGYVIKNTLSHFDQKEKVQEHYTLVKHYLGKPLLLDVAQWFLCASAAQLMDQPCITISFVIGSKIHHQKPQPVGFSHVG
jgi:hypothetical protein